MRSILSKDCLARKKVALFEVSVCSFFLNKLKAVDAIDRSVLSRDVGLSNFVKTESENRCANSG
jgi:hypothetical protein